MKPYFQESGITLYHGDCREILPHLPPCDLVLTDPPYGIGIANNPVRQKHERQSWDDQVVSPETLRAVMATATRQIIWGGNYFALPATQCFLLWDKMQPENFSLAMCEMAWTNLTGPAKMFRCSVTSYAKEHPTQKPVQLMEWCLKYGGGVSVFDPFTGSGTTGVACVRLGRQFIGCEIEERYCHVAASRIEKELSQGKLFEPQITEPARQMELVA